jgi:hypothetical protein
LQLLNLDFTSVTDGGVMELRRALPGCRIDHRKRDERPQKKEAK